MFERTSDSAFESIMDVCFQAVELYDDYDTMLTAVRTTNQNLKLMKRAELWGTSLNMGPIIKETRQSWIDAGSILASIFLGDTDDVLLDVCVSSMTMIRIMMELIGRYGEILLNYQNDDTAIEMTQILYYYQTLMTYWTIKAQYCKCQEIALRELSDDAVVLIMPQNWLDKDNINKWDSLAQDCFDLTLTYEDKMNSILQQVDNGYYDFLDRTDQTNNLDNIGFWKAVSPSNSLSSSISQSGTKEDFNLKLSETKEVVTWTQNETNVVEFQTYSKDNSKLFVAAYSVYLSSSLKLILDSKNINSKDGIFFKEENEVYSLSYNDKAVLQFLGAKEEKVEDAMESIVRFEADTNFEIDGFPLELLLLGTLLGIISISYIYLRKYKFLN